MKPFIHAAGPAPERPRSANPAGHPHSRTAPGAGPAQFHNLRKP